MKARVLVVDDDPHILEALQERLSARGFEVSLAADGDEALERASSVPDLILLDLELPRRDGQSVLEELRRRGIDSTVVVITAHGSIERAVAAMRAGAWDFVEKPFEPARLEETLRRALERDQLVRANAALRRTSEAETPLALAPAMQRLLQTARKAAESHSTLLLLGESGVGKEVLARQIHEWSPRCAGPFVPVHCAALSESLLESELFGHEKGAFTGADARRKGRLELAHGGTLFLDEIGDVPLDFQVKLLRVLQERCFERVGGNDSIEVDVRILAATHRDLAERIRTGLFREDLYYRLNVISLQVPPLRERPEDIEALAQRFVETLARETGHAQAPALTAHALASLRAHEWPGNVRELRNAIERALVLCDGEVIVAEDLPPDLVAAAERVPEDEGDDGFHAQVEAARRAIIERALEASDGNRTAAAERLGLQRTYLARLIRKYGL